MADISELISIAKDKLQGSSLKAKCARGAVILGTGAFGAKLLGLASKVILAWLLAPHDMGLMVLILSLTQLFQVLTEVGIKQSVIQHENGADEDFLNVAWWFQILRGIGLYMVAFMAAPFLCRFYFASKPEVLATHTFDELLALVRVAFLSVPFLAFISPRAYILEKELRFGKMVILSQGSMALGSLATIILAFAIRNIWALVIGFALAGVLGCALSYILCPFRPSLRFDTNSFRDMYKYARGVVGLPVLTYIAMNTDVLVAGKLIDTSLVGYYGMALVLANSPYDIFSRVINPILLPAFSKRQSDKDTLCKALVQITRYGAMLLVPPMALAITCGATVLDIPYKPEYTVVAVPFGFMCVYIIIRIQSMVFANMFFGIGQPGKHRTFTLARAVVLAALIYPAIKFFALTGAAAAVLLANIIAFCLQIIVAKKTIGLSAVRYLMSWVPGLILAAPVVLVTVAAGRLIPQWPILHFALGALVCALLCLAGLLIIGRRDILPRPAPREPRAQHLTT